MRGWSYWQSFRLKLVPRAAIDTSMFSVQARPALPIVAGLCLIAALSGCGDDGDVVEFSSQPSAAELELGDLIGDDGGNALSQSSSESEAERSALTVGAAAAQAKVIHFFSPSFVRPFSMVQMRLFQAFLREAGGPPVRFYDGREDADLQTKEVTDAIDAGASAIVVSPVDHAFLRSAVERARQAGIPVVVLGPSRNELPGNVNLPVDYYHVGQMAAEFIVQRLQIKARMEGALEVTGEIIEVTGSEDLNTTLERSIHAGLSSVIGRHPGVKIVHQAPGLWNPLGGAERVVEAARIQPGANVVFCHNDGMAHGVHLALRDQERDSDFLVVGVDGISGPDGGISRVRDQMLGATIAVPLMARQAAEAVMALVEGNVAPRFALPVPELVTIANSAEMYDRHMKLTFKKNQSQEMIKEGSE